MRNKILHRLDLYAMRILTIGFLIALMCILITRITYDLIETNLGMGIVKLYNRLKDRLSGDVVTSESEDYFPEPVKIDPIKEITQSYLERGPLDPLEKEDIVVSYPEDRNPNIINDSDLEEEPDDEPEEIVPKVAAPESFKKLQTTLRDPAAMKSGLAKFSAPFGQHPQDEFLDITSAVESNRGKNTNHAIIDKPKSIHFGMRAIGRYGLMPLTIQDTAKEIVNRQSDLGMALGKNYRDPEIEALAKMNPRKDFKNPKDKNNIEDYLKSRPDLELRLARYLATKLDNTSGKGNPVIKAYKWNQGTNLEAKKLADKNIKNHDYVQKWFEAKAKKTRMQSSIPKKIGPISSTKDVSTEEDS